jgi:putative flippase GtrA
MMAPVMLREFKQENFVGDGLRFIILGSANTILTLLVYQVLVSSLSPLLSYYLSWVIGLLVLLIAFPSYVFRGSRLTLRRALATIIIYICSLVFGGLLLAKMIVQGVHLRLAILFVVALTMIFNFSASRLIFRFMRF